MDTPYRVIMIDDDPVNNYICHLALKKIIKEPDFYSFTVPEKALLYIENEFAAESKDISAILLLDINMPSMTGWEVLDQYDTFSDELKSRLKVYILSSSVDFQDKQRVSENKNVIDYIVKPLTTEKIRVLFPGYLKIN